MKRMIIICFLSPFVFQSSAGIVRLFYFSPRRKERKDFLLDLFKSIIDKGKAIFH